MKYSPERREAILRKLLPVSGYQNLRNRCDRSQLLVAPSIKIMAPQPRQQNLFFEQR